MELTIEQIKDIEEMSAALLPPSEIAILIDIPSDQHNLFCEVISHICGISKRETSHQI